MKWRVLSLILLFIALGQPLTAQEPANPFGIVEGFWFPEATCDLGVSWERIIFNWEQHQPEKPDDWYTLNVDDRWLKAAGQCDREIVAVLKHTPAWATDDIAGPGLPRGLYLDYDDPENYWGQFVARTVDYYMSRGVKHFIIWNEPDIEAGTYGYEFGGTLEDYAQLLKVAYLAAKNTNPAAQIHLAGTTYWHDVNAGREPFFTRLVDHLMTDPSAETHDYYFDVLSLHIYFKTETVYDIVNEMRVMLDSRGLAHKRIWINETNAAPTDDPAWPVERPQFNLNLQHQADFLVQSAALGLAAGAERIAAYKLYDQELPPGGESFGLLSPPDATPRPAYDAWQTVTRHFQGVTSASYWTSSGVAAVNLSRVDGQMLTVMWARTGESARVSVAATGEKAVHLGLNGDMTIVRPENGVYNFRLSPALCDDTEGCYLGGHVRILLQPSGDIMIEQQTSGDSIPLVLKEE